MKLEDQVVSLNLAKKLKELGIKQDSLFYYGAHENPFDNVFKEEDVKHWRCDIYDSHFIDSSDYKYSAFTASELLELINIPVNLIKFNYEDCNIYYASPLGGSIYDDINPANACAKLLIYLIENGLIKNEVSGVC